MATQFNKIDRETWLTEAAQFILSDILAPLAELPTRPFRISIGFPSGKVSKVVAQCWSSNASSDGTNEIFVTPIIDDSIEILAALTHELIHYLDDLESGHRKFFAEAAREAGLEGKLTATVAGEALTEQLKGYTDILGDIPHAKIDPAHSGKKKQKTRMLKVQCNACAFNFRATQSNIGAMVFNNCLSCENGALHTENN